jgi:hypothetical protein
MIGHGAATISFIAIVVTTAGTQQQMRSHTS